MPATRSHRPVYLLTAPDGAQVLLGCINQDTSVRFSAISGRLLSKQCPDRVADDCLLRVILSHDWDAA